MSDDEPCTQCDWCGRRVALHETFVMGTGDMFVCKECCKETVVVAPPNGLMSESNQRPLHPYCNTCGWRKGGPDSWTGFACKCGHSEPLIRRYDTPATVTKLPAAPSD
jgi:hypothetical protein